MHAVLTILLVFAAAAAAILAIQRPAWAFALVVIMYPIEQLLQAYLPVFERNRALFNYFVAAWVAISVLLRFMKRWPVTAGWYNPVTILVGGQYILWLVGMFYSPARDIAVMNLQHYWPYALLFLLLLPLVVIDIAEFEKVLPVLMIVGTAAAVLIFLNPNSSYYAGRLTIDLGMLGGAKGERGNPLAVAEMGGLIALVAALYHPRHNGIGLRILRLSAFIAGLGVAIGSGSRGQALAACITGVLFYPLARQVRNARQFFALVIGFGFLVVGVILTFRLFIGEQNRARWDIGRLFEDMGLRLDTVWSFFAQYTSSPAHWLFGLGTNAFAATSNISGIQGNYVHNIAAEMFCEQGIVGFIIFVASIGLTAKLALRSWRWHSRDPAGRSVVALLMAISTYTLFLALKEGNITAMSPFFWWLVTAKLATVDNRELSLEAGLHEGDESMLEAEAYEAHRMYARS